MTLHKTKDNSFKLIFNDHELFAEFIRNYVPIEILKDISTEDIKDVSERFLPLFQENKDSDTIKQISLRNDQPLFVIAILEHESKVNYRTSFKMLQYISLVLTEYEKEASASNKNVPFAKGFKYPPVLPLVFYDGAGTWTAETNFLHKTTLNEVFEKYIPKFEYEIVKLSDYSEKDLISIGGVLSLIMLIDKIQDSGGINSLSKLPPEYMEKLQESLSPRLRNLLVNVITALLKRINIPDVEIETVTDRVQRKEIQEMFAWADNYDVQETRRIAKAEGRREGQRKQSLAIAQNLLNKQMSLDDIADATGLTREEVESLRGSDYKSTD